MATTLTKDRKTPGVYVTEFAAFPPTVVGVATAVPIFVGYTETAVDPSSKRQLYMTAVPISSMADYYSYFGYGYGAKGVVEHQPVDKDKVPIGNYDFEAPSSDGAWTTTHTLETKSYTYIVGTAQNTVGDPPVYSPQFNLYAAMQMFYANGGGDCFVISVNNYWGTSSVTPPAPDTAPKAVEEKWLSGGLDVANDVRGGTMLVVPDACLLMTATKGQDGVTTYTYPDYAKIANKMLEQSHRLQDRVAILDLPGALLPENWNATAMVQKEAPAFYEAIAPSMEYFSYGAAYAPAIESSLLSKTDLAYTGLTGSTDSATLVNNLLTTQALILYPPAFDVKDQPDEPHYSDQFVDVAAHIAAAFPAKGKADPDKTTSEPADITGTVTLGEDPTKLMVSLTDDAIYKAPASTDAAGQQTLDQYLLNAVPLLGNIQQILASKLDVVPPSGIMAGIWTQNDTNRGVWNAPANIAVADAIAPVVVLTDTQQGDFNMPLNGNAIDILRQMINRGTVVWGARTLDGNSPDYRYIQVRRTLIYIEQSIKLALQQFVFAPNDGGTWATVTATISNFLTQLWQAGGLMGDKASDAFTVKCGVPTTMSGQDVLNGYMIVNVTVQMIHPAEFIELTFTQTMQGV